MSEVYNSNDPPPPPPPGPPPSNPLPYLLPPTASSETDNGTSDSCMMGDTIWATLGLNYHSPLMELLESKSQFTLEDLLMEDELLQELKGCNPDLTRYFDDWFAIRELVDILLLVESSLDEASMEIVIRKKYMASEIIGCEMEFILQHLLQSHDGFAHSIQQQFEEDSITTHLSDESQAETDCKTETAVTPHSKQPDIILLDYYLSSILQSDRIDERNVGYLEKILSVVFQNCPQQTCDLFQSETLKEQMLSNVGIPTVKEIILKIILLDNSQKENAYPSDATTEGTVNHACNFVYSFACDNIYDEEHENGDLPRKFTCGWGADPVFIARLVDIFLSTDDMAEVANLSQIFEMLIGLEHTLLLEILFSDLILERMMLAISRIDQHNIRLGNHNVWTYQLHILSELLDHLAGINSDNEQETLTEIDLDDPSKTEAQHVLPDPKAATKRINTSIPSTIAIATILGNGLPLLLTQLTKYLSSPAWHTFKIPSPLHPEGQFLFGKPRLRIVQFLLELISYSYSDRYLINLIIDPERIQTAIVQSRILQISIQFLWDYEWCSSLQTSLQVLLELIIKHPQSTLYRHLLVDLHLQSSIMAKSSLSNHGSFQRGYMPLIRIISEQIHQQLLLTTKDQDPPTKGDPNITSSWDEFYVSCILPEITKQSRPLCDSVIPPEQNFWSNVELNHPTNNTDTDTDTDIPILSTEQNYFESSNDPLGKNVLSSDDEDRISTDRGHHEVPSGHCTDAPDELTEAEEDDAPVMDLFAGNFMMDQISGHTTAERPQMDGHTHGDNGKQFVPEQTPPEDKCFQADFASFDADFSADFSAPVGNFFDGSSSEDSAMAVVSSEDENMSSLKDSNTASTPGACGNFERSSEKANPDLFLDKISRHSIDDLFD